jgi:hypothetical protein
MPYQDEAKKKAYNDAYRENNQKHDKMPWDFPVKVGV